MSLSPADPGGYYGLADARYLNRDWPGALTALERCTQLEPLKNQGYIRARIWVLQMRMKTGAAANQQLSAYVDQRADEWTKKIGVFLLGKLTEPALVAAAESSDPQKNRLRHCEAWY